MLFGEVIEVASSKDRNFNFIPKGYEIPSDLNYLHITTNNTIFGTQFQEIPETKVPLIADMSSDIFSRSIDYSKFDLFYAGAQKNMGPSGTTLIIVKEDLLGKVSRTIPSMMNYQVQLKSDSMFNTPPVFPIYTSMLTLEWLEENGGINQIEKHNKTKAELIYNEIDRNSAFEGFAAKEDRSNMNATFNLVNGVDGSLFDSLWNQADISGLKGHRSVGGYRASIYNALPQESVELLVDVMKKFEQTL
jgi:phosphoserine aminotransferase